MIILEFQIQEPNFIYDHLPAHEDFISDLQWPMDMPFYPKDKGDEVNESGGGNDRGEAEE